MAPKKEAKQTDPAAELLKDLLIVELGKEGVPQAKIRDIVGCDMNRVSRIVKFLKKKKSQ